MNRRRSWHVQPTETPIASAVCSSDNPNSSGSSTARACRNWPAVFAVTTRALACRTTSIPLACLAMAAPPIKDVRLLLHY
jgi:hypothetical protein